MAATIKARPTLYKGIQMRSRLEADYAANLDALGYRWGYEPECFASADGQWLPDFGSSFADEGPFAIFTEVKPAGPLADWIPGSADYIKHVDTILKQMTIAWESQPGLSLHLAFWQYGGPAYLHIWSPGHGMPWMVVTSPVDLPWVGMGQMYRICPYEIEAEQVVLGSMMLNPRCIDVALKTMKPDDHYRPAHQLLHLAILDLFARGEPTDAVAVATELTRNGDIKKIGGAPYLHLLLEKADPVWAHSCARTVAELSSKRAP
jgi:hypothetical protein